MLWIFLLIVFAPPVSSECLTEKSVRQLDLRFENALLSGDYVVLEDLLHPKFVWVHDKATQIHRSRAQLVDPLRQAWPPRPETVMNASRKQHGVSVSIIGSTAIIYGFTDVVRTKYYASTTNSSRRMRHHFMRTYTETEKKCRLVANHTQEVWREKPW